MAASWSLSSRTLLILLVAGFVNLCMGSRKLASLVETPQILLTYHNGALLNGEIPISILWYGKFTAAQKSIISDFILSLTPNTVRPLSPSVSQWWTTIDQFYVGEKTQIILAGQVSDESCSLGKSIKRVQLTALAAKAGAKKGGIALVLTAADVAVEGFCSSSCGSHGSDRGSSSVYIWVGNSATQCPGQCAWPFHQPAYGPQALPLTAPNGDVGVDGMVANVASMVAAAVTNPYGGGFYQGPAGAPLEAATACAGAYGRGAYPGYAGDLLVDPATGASYNANGPHERKYLLPALFDPSTSKCSTLV